MMAPFRFVIVGGGTAGWMTALLLAKRMAEPAMNQIRPVQITLLEAPEIGIIGVGEGSTPSLKRFFQQLNIAESEWMPACQATYKTNIRFCHWTEAEYAGAKQAQQYSHPFLSQLDVHSELAFYSNCFKRRCGLAVTTDPAKFLFNGWLAERALAPVAGAHFPFRLEYGYHFDSGLLGQFLRQKAQALGVQYQALTINQVEQWPDGCIRAVAGLNTSQQLMRIDADFFIDCSGFQAMLLQKVLQVPFQSFQNNLFNDAAVVLPTAAQPELPVETTATALSNGWAWQIPLRHRTGNGYVYSSAFTSPETAERELRTHLGLADDVPARHLQMRVGQVSQHWHKNCLAVGLSQGFIEPLEATALHLVQSTVESFIDCLVSHQYLQRADFANQQLAQQRFNSEICNRFERVRDYIVAHYKLNNRHDSDYWRQNRAQSQLSESLLQLLDVWYRRGDLAQEIARQQLDCHFGNTSWHCLLAGYQVFPALLAPQPVAVSDAYLDSELAQLFTGCCLNFTAQSRLLSPAQDTAFSALMRTYA